MSRDFIRARNILGIYLSFSVGLVLLFVINELATDDLKTSFLLSLSIFSITLLVLVISSLTSNWMGQNCDYKLQSALLSAGANMLGVILIALGLAVLGVDLSSLNFSSLVFQIIIASGFTSVISSLIGSIGRDVPFAKSSDLNEDEYFAPQIDRPHRSIPAAYEENGYEWLHRDDGTAWFRIGGGFPDPNNWEQYETN